MHPDEYQRMYDGERSHFWFRGTRAVVFDQVRSLADSPLDVLDVGCGTGGTITQMPAAWRPLGVDYAAEALRLAASRGQGRLVRASGERLPLPAGRFDLAFALDVIEHCDDDALVASELHRVLRPGGLLVATVPAFQILFGPHDIALGHRRRYRRGPFGALLRGAGFSVEKLSYFNTILFAPIGATRLATKILPGNRASKSDLVPLPPRLNEILFRIFASERSVLRSVDLPFGLSILAVARRRG